MKKQRFFTYDTKTKKLLEYFDYRHAENNYCKKRFYALIVENENDTLIITRTGINQFNSTNEALLHLSS